MPQSRRGVERSVARVADICRTTIWVAVGLYAFFLPWGVSGAEIALTIGVLAWIAHSVAERRVIWVGKPVGWPVLVFVLVMLAASLCGWVRSETLREFASLRHLLAIFLVASTLRGEPGLRSEEGLRRITLVVVGTLALFSLYAVSARLVMVARHEAFHVPLIVSKARAQEIRDDQKERVEARKHEQSNDREPIGATSTGFWLPDLGSMSEAGQLAIGFPIALALVLAVRRKRLRVALIVAAVLLAANLILNMKRGAWVACFAALLVLAVVEKRRLVLVVLVVLIAAGAAVPSARNRVVQAFAGDVGQRLKLWRAVPEIVRRYPLGVGPGCSYHVIRSKELVPRDVYLQMPHRVHFHNTIAELAVVAGPLAVVAFLWWFGAFGLWALKRLRRMSPDAAARPLVVAGLVAAVAFFVNGLFEYNLGDSDVTLMLYLLMGAAIAAASTQESASGQMPTKRAPHEGQNTLNGKL